MKGIEAYKEAKVNKGNKKGYLMCGG